MCVWKGAQFTIQSESLFDWGKGCNGGMRYGSKIVTTYSVTTSSKVLVKEST